MNTEEQKIRIITEDQKINRDELKRIAEEKFGDMVKAVVDIDRKIMAIGGDLHADEEAMLLENGSSQSDLWGINLYPNNKEEEFIEFDSMINLRPRQNNRSRNVEDEELRKQIIEVVNLLTKDE